METEVQLLCPDCSEAWSVQPEILPPHDDRFECPDCGATRPTAEFTRTKRDLRTLKQFAG